jgi:hypothetical protein
VRRDVPNIVHIPVEADHGVQHSFSIYMDRIYIKLI